MNSLVVLALCSFFFVADLAAADKFYLYSTVNDLINAHSQINAPYLIDTPLEVYSLY